jgi:antagonist of KipI
MDKLSAQFANILVGNELYEEVIELHFHASAFFFEQPSLIAIIGADFSATVNGEEIPSLRPILVSKFSILQFHQVQKGARAYLSVHGGIDVPGWLNSRSTNLKAITGGHMGRALQKDDELRFRKQVDFCDILGKKEFEVLPWKTDGNWGDKHPGTREILIVKGNEWGRLTAQSQKDFFDQAFLISKQSDRMGYRLRSQPLEVTDNEEILSSAVSFGTVQLLPDGQLIVLMADHQTSGGYPRIAHVISAHHSRLAQMQADDLFIFRLTDQLTAEELYLKQQRHLLQLQNACKFKLEELLSQ